MASMASAVILRYVVMGLPSLSHSGAGVEYRHVLCEPFGQWWVAGIVGVCQWRSDCGMLLRLVLQAVGAEHGGDVSYG